MSIHLNSMSSDFTGFKSRTSHFPKTLSETFFLQNSMYLSLTAKGIIAIIFALIVAFLVIFTAGAVGL
jgi:hypothetical protein